MSHKILIVDDDRLNTALVKFGLAEQYYEVREAADGRKALEIIRSWTPDLIVLDVLMPNMNGYEFIGELKAMQGADLTPVIMLTANETMEDMFKLEGVREYFVKPVDLKSLLASIKKYLGENPI